jgi:hypothetical protein
MKVRVVALRARLVSFSTQAFVGSQYVYQSKKNGKNIRSTMLSFCRVTEQLLSIFLPKLLPVTNE